MMRPYNENKFLTPKVIRRDFFKYKEKLDDWMRTSPEKILKLSQTKGCYYFEICSDTKSILMLGTQKACRKLRAWLELLCTQQEELLMLEAVNEIDKKELERVEQQYEDAVKCEFSISQDLVRTPSDAEGPTFKKQKRY